LPPLPRPPLSSLSQNNTTLLSNITNIQLIQRRRIHAKSMPIIYNNNSTTANNTQNSMEKNDEINLIQRHQSCPTSLLLPLLSTVNQTKGNDVQSSTSPIKIDHQHQINAQDNRSIKMTNENIKPIDLLSKENEMILMTESNNECI
ncbi:unnamed protein product, partial [Schistosoma turkestanicum]